MFFTSYFAAKCFMSFVAMIYMIHLDNSEEVITLLYEKYLQSCKKKHWDGKIARLNMRFLD